MASLAEDLQNTKSDLVEFKDVANRVLDYMPAVIDERIEYLDYVLCSSTTAGTRKRIRPFNKNLFLNSSPDFINQFEELIQILEKLKTSDRNFSAEDFKIVDSVVYTVQQSIGIGLDLLVAPNSARKHVGNRFEELIRILLKAIKIPTKKVVLAIPYETDEGQKYYRCETDVIISPYSKVRSDTKSIDPHEIVISLKTTTKDRMPKIFIDKILMERFLDHEVRMVGISLNDIQRKEEKGKIKTSYTFVSNLFMVYTKFLAELEGYYYLDIPKRALEAPFTNHVFAFSKFLLEDVWSLLDS